MTLLRSLAVMPRRAACVFAGLGQAHVWLENCRRTLHGLALLALPALFLSRTARQEVYNVLWALVFAFATLNILTLGARHFEADRRGLSFGEVLAILVVVLSVFMLGWEMLYLFHILPLRVVPH